jgi:hypothetical protein
MTTAILFVATASAPLAGVVRFLPAMLDDAMAGRNMASGKMLMLHAVRNEE